MTYLLVGVIICLGPDTLLDTKGATYTLMASKDSVAVERAYEKTLQNNRLEDGCTIHGLHIETEQTND